MYSLKKYNTLFIPELNLTLTLHFYTYCLHCIHERMFAFIMPYTTASG